MLSLFTLIFIASIVWFFIARRKDKKSNGKISKNTWYIFILTAISFILVGVTTPKQNTQVSESSRTASKKSASDDSITKNDSKKTPSSRLTSKKQSNAKSANKTNTQLTLFNEWYKNNYYDEQEATYKKDGKEYFGTKEQIMETALVGFKIENGDLIAVINNNRLKGEKLTQKEVANYAFNVVYNDYSGDLPHYDNLRSDGSIKQDVMLHPERYSTLE